jgi:arogenate dehydrogenase (NADP+)
MSQFSIQAPFEPKGDRPQAIAQLTTSLSGFRDTSRVGSGNSELGRVIAQYNQNELLRSIQFYRQSLDRIETLIEPLVFSLKDLLSRQQQAGEQR